MSDTTFIAVDWGSSNCRAYLCVDGRIEASKEQATGVKNLAADDFEGVFDVLIADWQGQVEDVYLTGMITSRSGWVETPYAVCPAGLVDLADEAVTVHRKGLDLVFLPGLCQRGESADVMRGEELQIFGLADGIGEQIVVLPGTHSKWALVRDGRACRFTTIMTGELFDLVLNHSLAGRLADGVALDPLVFDGAVAKALETARPISDLFAARSRVLMDVMPPTSVASYLSGLLIGAEIREGRDTFPEAGKGVILAGSEALVHRYARALEIAGIPASHAAGEPVLNALVGIHAMRVNNRSGHCVMATKADEVV